MYAQSEVLIANKTSLDAFGINQISRVSHTSNARNKKYHSDISLLYLLVAGKSFWRKIISMVLLHYFFGMYVSFRSSTPSLTFTSNRPMIIVFNLS